MRLPRLQLPAVSLDWLEAIGGRTTLLYVGYAAALFAVFLVLTFPHELLVRRVLSSIDTGPVTVDLSSVDFAWYEGYEISGLRVLPAAAGGETPYLECSHLWVRPSLAGIARGTPYDFLLSADLYGGAAQGEVVSSGGAVNGTLQWQGLRLDRYRTLTALLDAGQVTGRLSGQLSFQRRGGPGDASEGSGDVLLDSLGLTGGKFQGFGLPDVHLRQAKLRFAVHGDRLEIQEFTATGDVNVQVSGHIMLRTPMSESALNLRGTIVTSLATPDALKAAVALIPRNPGVKPDAPIAITGTIGRPRTR